MSGKRSDFISWDEYFMGVSLLAAKRSKDPNTQVGACIVNQDHIIISTGYNGFPKNCSDDVFPWERTGKDTKYAYVVHAELNAILNARCSVEGWTIYVTEAPCHECSNAIVQAGIKRAVTGAPRRDSSWHRSQLEGRETMREAGLIVDTWEER